MPKIVNKEEMRDAILTAAETVFLRDGVTQAKMLDIAAEMGVAKGTIYLYFPSKDALISALVDRFFQSAHKRLSGLPVPATVGEFQDMLLQLLEEHSPVQSELLRFFTLFGGALKDPKILAPLKGFFDAFADYLATVLRDLCPTLPDPIGTARSLVSVFDGLTLHRGLFGHNPTADTTKRLIAALLHTS